MSQNWMCPVDGDAEIWDSPIAAVTHIYNMKGRGHGNKGSIIRQDNEVLLPEPVDSEANMDVVSDDLEEYPFLPDDVKSLIEDLEQEGWETPPVLTQTDAETFEILEVSSGVENDLDRIQNDIEYINRVVEYCLKNINSLSEPAEIDPDVIVEDEEEDEEDEQEDDITQQGGRYTTADVKEAEEDQVLSVIKRSVFLDDHSDDIITTFEHVYKKRDSEGIRVSEVSNKMGAPESMIEENLETLEEKNLIEWNEDDDLYYVPY